MKASRNWIAFFILGTINNLGYVVILASAQDLARSFHKENLIGLIPWANVALGLVVRSVNAFALDNSAYGWRILVNAVVYILGVVGVAMSIYISFSFSIASIVLVGSASSFGESVLLGYLRLHAPDLVGGWSSGTGLAGVLGAVYYLLLILAGLHHVLIFLSLIPFIFIYVFTFFFIVDHNHEKKEETTEKTALLETHTSDDEGEHEILVNEKEQNKGTLRRRVESTLKIVLYPSTCLALVYFAEYVIQTGGADKAEHKDWDSSSNFAVRHSFVILQFCYQTAVLISRSSLKCIRIRRIGLLTIVQQLNLVLWILQDIYKFMSIYVQFAAMFFVGLLGGACYVNVFFEILEDERILDHNRELAVNITALFINIGIVSSCAFVVFMDNTFLEKY